MRLMIRDVRNVMAARHKLKPGSLGCIYQVHLLYMIPVSNLKPEDDKTMEVDMSSQSPSKQNVLPELEILCYLIVLIYLIDQKQCKQLYLGKIRTIQLEYIMPQEKHRQFPVASGYNELFRSVADKFSATFYADKTHNLIVPDRFVKHQYLHSVISLADVAAKLHLSWATAVRN
ncbi:hypothetical protein SELMODRAFT_408501 [Selaginella moellendorffii]|uniref:Uncharacterized protein n=1 Tax=Selaginella moellendorffii TaxID=88036 RepID=D8R8I1_SELML|nr:hypothetical protein SELMODRAFT_408501 [Selaginella moellendorffii]